MNANDIKLLEEKLAEIESSTEPLSEHQICDALQKLYKESEYSSRPMEWWAEVMAFDFRGEYTHKETGWGTYFGPRIVWSDDEGNQTESPSIKKITAEMLGYWSKRAINTKHPILKTRYAALVWDFTKPVTGKPAPVKMAWIRIDSAIAAAISNKHKSKSEIIKKLKHALQLAISISDTTRSEQVQDAILSYEDNVAQDDKLGLWGFSFDCLISQKKVGLSKTNELKIIHDLEKRLDRVSDASGESVLDPWAAEVAAIRLAKYYRAKEKSDDVKRVLLKYGSAFEKMSESADAMLKQGWLQQVLKIYRSFGLKGESERLLKIIHELNPKVLDDLKPISVKTEISNEEINGYVQEMTEGNSEVVLARIAGYYLPRKDQIEKQLHDLATHAPISSHIPMKLVDHKGRPIASVGSVENDLPGRIVMQMAQNIHFEAFFLRRVMSTVVSKFELTQKILTDYVYKSPLFEIENRSIIEKGFDAYLNEDSLVTIHVLIPQIENAIRILIENIGGTVLKPNRRTGGLDLKTFDELLREKYLNEIFGDDIPLYFQVLFTDRRGINLRNKVFHGISSIAIFNIANADRVIHSLLILSHIRKKEEVYTE